MYICPQQNAITKRCYIFAGILALLVTSCSNPKADVKKVLDASRVGDLQAVRSEVDKDSTFPGELNQIGPQLPLTPMHVAAFEGHADVLRYLVSKGVQVDLRDANGATALMQASAGGQSESVKALLACGADPNAKDGSFSTSLSLAASGGKTEVARILLDAGASVDGQAGVKPLYLAAVGGYVETVRLLLDRGADVSKYDIRLSSEKGHKDVASTLRKAFIKKYGIDPDLYDKGNVSSR